jgi:hypothetical protein
MQKRIKKFYLVAAFFLVLLAGCTDGKSGSGPVSFTSEYVPMTFQFPSGWHLNKDDHPYDLQCFSQFKAMNTGVFAFKKSDLATDSTPTDIFWAQIEDLESKRENFKIFEDESKSETESLIITTIAFKGDKGHSSFCYKFSLIEFKSDETVFAVTLQVTAPGNWEKNQPVFDEIIQSAQLLGAGE